MSNYYQDSIKKSIPLIRWGVVTNNIDNGQSGIIQVRIDGVDDTVKIVKYENLNEDLSKLFKKEINLPVVNKSNHGYYLDYYDEAAFTTVNKKYIEDFKRYDYKMITN